jgi:hypothetical protein
MGLGRDDSFPAAQFCPQQKSAKNILLPFLEKIPKTLNKIESSKDQLALGNAITNV